MQVFPTSRVWAAFVLPTILCCPLLRAQNPPPKTPGVNAESLVVESFENQVNEYVKLHKKVQSGIPPLKEKSSADEIGRYQRLLANRIRGARQPAKKGDIFSPEVSGEFRRLISVAYQMTNAARIRKSLRHAEPVENVRLKVNAVYPERIPVQSTPPSILLNLPKLPPELDYRIVGRALVLRDVEANIIVDYIKNALPAA
jgi:hypothetical protein